MSDKIIVSIDAMGGDNGPEMVIPGVDLALERHSGLSVILHGDLERVGPIVERHPRVLDRGELCHADVSVGMDDKPSQALRHGRRVSSMWRAIESVKAGDAASVVSAGNTGALMAMSRFVLNTMPGVERPAIAAIWPTMRGESIVLDVGSTIGADAEQLFDFAIMGEAMARSMYGIERPTVALLNVGVEEIKGLEQVKQAGRLLRASRLPIEYSGFIEGNDIGRGAADVVVTEGFTGNIAMKAAEGTARQIASYLRSEMSRTIWSRLGYLLARGAFHALKEKMDPTKRNGGVFLGLNGIVVKSHGGTDPMGFASAVDVAIEMSLNQLVEKIARDMTKKQSLSEIRPAGDAAAAAR